MYKFIFILVIIGLLINCSDKDPIDPDPPNRVLLVMKEEGFDTLEVERGIDAEPNPNSAVNGIHLEWYDPTDKYRIEYYNLYRSGDVEGRLNYKMVGNTENLLNPLDTVYIDTTQGLSNNHRYWYYVTAVNEDGDESEPSDTVHYTLIEKATELSINNYNPVLTDSNITFMWSVDSDDIPVGYYLRVEQNISESFHPLAFFREISVNEVDYNPPQTYEVSLEEFKVPVMEDQNYRWRIDCVGTDLYSGAESDWAEFTVNMEQ
ncbi:MAG: hypothetical protein P8Y99_06160 [Calditrichaceae bacterium]